MSLYDILVSRPCIWILKELYEAEVVNKKIYTVRVSDLKKYINVSNPELYVSILHENGLLHVDDTNKDKIISLNQKGKEFFRLFDKLKIHTESQVKIIDDQPIARIDYDLNEDEKKALFTVHKITQLIGDELPIKSLIIDDKKQEAAYEKLEKLNLITKMKNTKGKTTVSLTSAGQKVIQHELSEKLK